MKRLLLSLMALAFLGSCHHTIDIENEKKAVIAVSEEERDAYMDRNLDRLEAIWIQEPTSQRRFASAWLKGWEEVRANYEEDINDTELWASMDNVSASFVNYNANIYGNTALLYHDIQWTGTFRGEPIDRIQNRIVHLVKKDGTWKIDLIIQIPVPGEF